MLAKIQYDKALILSAQQQTLEASEAIDQARAFATRSRGIRDLETDKLIDPLSDHILFARYDLVKAFICLENKEFKQARLLSKYAEETVQRQFSGHKDVVKVNYTLNRIRQVLLQDEEKKED